MSWSRNQVASFAAQGAALRLATVSVPFTWKSKTLCGAFSALRRGREQDEQGGGFATTAACTLRVDRAHAAAKGFVPALGDLVVRSDTAATLRIADIADNGVAAEIVITLADPTV